MVKTIGQVEGDGFVVSPDIRIDNDSGLLGEIKQFALSISGALTKSQLQARGWAICDGTTPASQGISDATITTTPDLRERFLRHSADETTGGTGGINDNIHIWVNKTGSEGSGKSSISGYSDTNTVQQTSFNSSGAVANIAIGYADSNASYINGPYYTDKQDNRPPYYDICYFIKVK